MSEANSRGPSDRSGPSTECVLRALADQRRRLVLDYLDGRASPARLDQIASHVAAETAEDPGIVRLDLHHTHLPALANASLVQYDSTDHVATLGDGAPDAASLNDLLRNRES